MTTPVWEWINADAREAYERLHGHQPPGFRGTGSWQWFKRMHPDTAPCCKCGVVTDRWVGGTAYVGFVNWGTPHVDQRMGPREAPEKKRVLLWERTWPFCEVCERRASIAVLKQRQQNPVMLPAVKAREAMYLAELMQLNREAA